MKNNYGIIIDLDRCIGCETCVIACKAENDLEKTSGIRIELIGGKHKDTPAGRYPYLYMGYKPKMCMQCSDAPCVNVCESDAIYYSDGILLIDEEKCIGCQLCIQECPFGIVSYDEAQSVAWKCTLCKHRIDEKLAPFCVVCCENEAMLFIDLNNIDNELSKKCNRNKEINLELMAQNYYRVYYLGTKLEQDNR